MVVSFRGNRGLTSFAQRKVCAVCRYFEGETRTGDGPCLKLGGTTRGADNGCEKFDRRTLGVDPPPRWTEAREALEEVPPAPPIVPTPPPPPAPPVAKAPNPGTLAERMSRLPIEHMRVQELADALQCPLTSVRATLTKLKRSAAPTPRLGPKEPNANVLEGRRRRAEIARLAAEGKGGPEVAEAMGLPLKTVHRVASDAKIKLPTVRMPKAAPVAAEEPAAKAPERPAHTAGHIPTPEMGNPITAPSPPAVLEILKPPTLEMGNPISEPVVPVAAPAPEIVNPMSEPRDKAAAKRATRAAASRQKVRDRRRFKENIAPTGKASTVAPDDPRGTIYTSMVRVPGPGDRVLIDGANNTKVGGDVLKGGLAGARILTLALEERATCPRSCAVWSVCYGNNLPFTTRWVDGPELREAICNELHQLTSGGRPVLVRLHQLGDFTGIGYLAFWLVMMETFPTLHVYGFTAYPPDSTIGLMVGMLRSTFKSSLPGVVSRFAVRHSGFTGPWGSFTFDWPPSEARPRYGTGVVCPEQVDATREVQDRRHCGNCALCWHSDTPILFSEH